MNKEECLHEDLENGICTDCGKEIDWTKAFIGWDKGDKLCLNLK